MYSTIFGSEKNPKISCPRIDFYNWTGPLQWFKNCKALQEPKYRTHKSFLIIDNVRRDDEGDYTCKFIHTENGVDYNVTATRSFKVADQNSFSMFPVIIAPPYNETKEVEIGETVNLTCFACFGKGAQVLAAVLWQVNKTKVEDFGEARIQKDEGQNQSSSDELTCLNSTLRITDVQEEDLSWEYDCLALNLHGVLRHTMRLRRKKPIDQQSIYYIASGCSLLLILVSILVMLLKVFWIEFSLFWRDIALPYKIRNDGKLYDAYVIYPRNFKSSIERASSVEFFVHHILPDVLENKCGYKLCIYGRDMLPGEDAVTAVETSIQKSRRHMFILTHHMMHSKEFAYEQEIALHSALIHNDSKVILIEMEALGEPGGLPLECFQDSLKHLVKMQGTIKWRQDHVANKRSLGSKFWKHVRYQMPVPSKMTSGVAPLNAQAHWAYFLQLENESLKMDPGGWAALDICQLHSKINTARTWALQQNFFYLHDFPSPPPPPPRRGLDLLILALQPLNPVQLWLLEAWGVCTSAVPWGSGVLTALGFVAPCSLKGALWPPPDLEGGLLRVPSQRPQPDKDAPRDFPPVPFAPAILSSWVGHLRV
uniref:interleukin-1 receptor-like 1 n=1 Tax=Jaculus jaculus TaxID=51337 RepID=UPI001E1B0B05|nr:interleukin-1 receptor-like 1 [Jaculus jaculus]